MKKILLTGATGYIGKRLLLVLLEQGYHVTCCTRDVYRFEIPEGAPEEKIDVIEVDFLQKETLHNIPSDIDAAYYLMHSMSTSTNYQEMEMTCAINFRKAISATSAEQVIYLTGMINADELSSHLLSRQKVEEELAQGSYHFTALRAGIIIGSGSASFEIIRDLVEKLPVMITPKWVQTLCQPIGVANVLDFLTASLFNVDTYDENFDIGCPDVLTYKDMLLEYARIRELKRSIFIVPVMTPRLSSYWLYFVTSTSFKLATSLVDSMKVEVVARDRRINDITGINPFSYEEALRRTLSKVEAEEIISSWKDSFVSSGENFILSDYINIPTHGCFSDIRTKTCDSREACIERIWRIGGKNGWYSAHILWKIRGFLDQVAGGVGLRRGRTHSDQLHAGDAVDFWRVLYADKKEGLLLLFAEMKLPGEAWLEFNVKGNTLQQRAVFRPKGLWGRLYWYIVYPFHGIVFNSMINRLAKEKSSV